MKRCPKLAPLLWLFLTTAVAAADPPDLDVFGAGVRPTPWLSPDQEMEAFHLLPDFEIRLFASEPQIAKPLNLAPDARGRIWVTCTVEYPYPAAEGTTPRDFLMILSDSDGDGAADQVTRFADELNIPIGVLPYGEGCICFSIPNLLYLRDTDNDGICDQRDVILGPFDTTRDTHGMINALRDGGDGWIYACHGFNNQSEVAGKDGHQVKMSSGNTFRFRPDGSRVELFTQGQVNPFGMAEDEWGYRYTADCHSKPLTQLIRGACYPSFGRPHDGLGFLPSMMDHLHGSTAICGLEYIPPTSPIVPLRGQFISGNVMTSRINRNELVFHGATAKAREMDDFLSCDDPWFRPVDIRLASDGHLYVADFYNKIIGHYEVPLDHPERDRTSGRIWQIRYTGPKSPDESEPASQWPSMQQVLSALRTIARHGKLQDLDLEVASQDEPRLRVEALRLLPELDKPPAHLTDWARQSLDDTHPHVQRAAAECVGLLGESSDVPRLLEHLKRVDTNDPVLRQTYRIAIRNLLRAAPSDDAIWSGEVDSEWTSILLGVQQRQAAAMILRFLESQPEAADRATLLSHAVKHADESLLKQAVEVARQTTTDNRDQALELLDVMCTSQNARPGQVPEALRVWALDLVRSGLQTLDKNQPLISWSDGDRDWPSESRKTLDAGDQMLTSSFGLGEKYIGRLVSDPFSAPERIRFVLAGHNGYPDQPDHGKNRIRLLHDETGQVLHEATPPRNDRAVRIDWDTQSIRGQSVRIECIDGDGAAAYAWIAFGDFDPDWLHPSNASASLRQTLAWITRLGLNEFAPELESMASNDRLSAPLRAEIMSTLAGLRGDSEAAVVFASLRQTGAPIAAIEQFIAAYKGRQDGVEPNELWSEATKQFCKRLSAAEQRSFVLAWIARGASIDRLIELVDAGWISPQVFIDANVRQSLQPRLQEDQQQRIEALTGGLDESQDLALRLSELQQQVRIDQADAVRGKQLYTQHCSACHQLRGEGAVVGPQLDGAATRSVARLLEDVVTPDRNVDRAFRTTSFLLDDGRVVVGLVTDETDREITLVTSDGKPVKIETGSIERRKEAGRSLMPSNMAEVLKPEDFADLLKYIRG